MCLMSFLMKHNIFGRRTVLNETNLVHNNTLAGTRGLYRRFLAY